MRFHQVCILALAAMSFACAGGPLEKKLLQDVDYYSDNHLPFQPRRLWRLLVSWKPYPLDDAKAMIVKEFQLEVKDERERKRLEGEIEKRGGDQRYLDWFESELFPQGHWERRDQAHVARYRNRMVVVLTTKSEKEVGRPGLLTVAPISFPDPLFKALHDGCAELNWDVIAPGESLGMEIVLETRHENPSARRWALKEADLPNFSWRSWSVGQGRRISYRSFARVKNNISKCPLPPKVYAEMRRFEQGQDMGIEW